MSNTLQNKLIGIWILKKVGKLFQRLVILRVRYHNNLSITRTLKFIAYCHKNFTVVVDIKIEI